MRTALLLLLARGNSREDATELHHAGLNLQETDHHSRTSSGQGQSYTLAQ